MLALAGTAGWWFVSRDDPTTGSGVDVVSTLKEYGVTCQTGLMSDVPLPREDLLKLFQERSGTLGVHADQLQPVIEPLPPGTMIHTQICGTTTRTSWIVTVDGEVLAIGVPAEQLAQIEKDLRDPGIVLVSI